MQVLATPRGVREEGDGGRRRARGGGGGGGMRELEELLNIKDGKVVGALQCEPDERRQRADAIDRANARRRGGRRRFLACPDRRVGAAAVGCRYAGASATPSRWRRVRRRARAAHGGAPAARASPRLGASARRLREGV